MRSKGNNSNYSVHTDVKTNNACCVYTLCLFYSYDYVITPMHIVPSVKVNAEKTHCLHVTSVPSVTVAMTMNYYSRKGFRPSVMTATSPIDENSDWYFKIRNFFEFDLISMNHFEIHTKVARTRLFSIDSRSHSLCSCCYSIKTYITKTVTYHIIIFCVWT